jgi:hypothetical protein
MCFAMLTFGNLGMLAGWWMDNGFAPLHGHCRECIAILQTGAIATPWMWLGMLALSNFAMIFLPRRASGRGRDHSIAMFTGGNLGMVLVMIAGAWWALQFDIDSLTAAAVVSIAGMTLGMLAGMLAGTWMTEVIISVVRAVVRMPRWLRGRGLIPHEVIRGEAEGDRDDRVADIVRG